MFLYFELQVTEIGVWYLLSTRIVKPIAPILAVPAIILFFYALFATVSRESPLDFPQMLSVDTTVLAANSFIRVYQLHTANLE